jgi:hypothetical protein
MSPPRIREVQDGYKMAHDRQGHDRERHIERDLQWRPVDLIMSIG